MARVNRFAVRIRPGLIAFFVIAFLLRLAIVEFRNFGFPPGWGAETAAVASALASGRGFSDAYGESSGPTALLPPTYPLLLAGLFELFGPSPFQAGMVALYLNAILSALVVFPIYAVGKRLFAENAGLLGAFLWSIYPLTGHTEARWIWNTSLVVLLLAVFVQIALRISKRDPVQRWAAFWLIAGFLSLTEPMALLVLASAAVWLFLFRERRTSRWVIALACVLACVGPWVIRNWVVMGRPLLRSNLGLELARGITEEDFSNLERRIRLPNRDKLELEAYKSLGEIKYMQEKFDLARSFAAEHPFAYFQIVVRRFVAYWTGSAELQYLYWPAWRWRAFKHILYTLPTLCALGGLLLLRGKPEFWLFLLLVALFPSVYYLTYTSPRYRAPLEPVLLVLSAGYLSMLLDRIRAWLGWRAAPAAQSSERG